ncbi:MAG: leucyl aminopeptidase [Wenzhouxiangellaceae bacterium]
MSIKTVTFKIAPEDWAGSGTGCVIIGAFASQPTSEQPWLSEIDRATDGLLQQLSEDGELPRSAGQTLLIHRPQGLKAQRLLITGLGKPGDFDAATYVRAARGAGQALRKSRATDAVCLLPQIPVNGRDPAWKAAQAALAIDHGDYVYDHTKPQSPDAAPATDTVAFPDGDGVAAALEQAQAVAVGIRRCRILGDLPPNICTPEYLAETARALAQAHDRLQVEVLDEAGMEALGMHSLLAVGRGSTHKPRLIHLSWRGGPVQQRPLVLVGKGVTFDTGGISIKPRDQMEQMKFDMCGAAAALGAIEACARLGLPINVDAVIAAVENMPDGNAYRPGDVIRTLSGLTVEVHNTDAEGRMILADALTWSARELDPEVMVDLATLTGACVVALGHHASAVMTRDDALAAELVEAGERAMDRAWRLPLWREYQEQLESPFADMKNVGGMPAGAITAGCFLARFTEGRRWAHVDIAGSAWRWGKAESASGRPVALLAEWLVRRARNHG